MKKTIYNVYVVMESQEQCDRMKQVCVDNGLPIDYGFIFDCKYFEYSELFQEWNVWLTVDHEKTKVTESEFLEILKTTK